MESSFTPAGPAYLQIFVHKCDFDSIDLNVLISLNTFNEFHLHKLVPDIVGLKCCSY